MKKLINYQHSEWIDVFDHRLHVDQIIDLLQPILTEERLEKIDETIPLRCRDVAIVLENIFDVGNINAVIRSMEGLGYHQLHSIENKLLMKANRITRGADKWLDINNWKESKECIQNLKSKGYKIVATHLDDKAKPIDEIDFTEKTAIVFGSESNGITDEMIELCDETCILPMDGFSQSYNISVAAALAMQAIKFQRVEKLGKHGDCGELDQKIIKATYYLMSAPRPLDRLLRNLLEHPNNKEIVDREF